MTKKDDDAYRKMIQEHRAAIREYRAALKKFKSPAVARKKSKRRVASV